MHWKKETREGNRLTVSFGAHWAKSGLSSLTLFPFFPRSLPSPRMDPSRRKNAWTYFSVSHVACCAAGGDEERLPCGAANQERDLFHSQTLALRWGLRSTHASGEKRTCVHVPLTMGSILCARREGWRWSREWQCSWQKGRSRWQNK